MIRVARVSKSYQLYRKPEHRFLQSLFRGKRRFYQEFHALTDVSFEVARGETLGIIGRNGSGKSTLLEIIAGTLTATAGAVEVRGRTSAILELGAGFNPEFTGRENVVLSTAVHGMTRQETESRMDEIIRFSDIGEYIDQPVKTYSSGMYARLAFSVAIHVNPDVLIIDEALAVGDAKFQAQCFRKFDEFKRKGVSILFVSHSADQIVRHCSRALLLDQGRMVTLGEPKDVVAHYLELLFGVATPQPRAPQRSGAGLASAAPMAAVFEGASAGGADAGEGDAFARRPTYNRLEHRWGNGRGRLLDYRLIDSNGREAVSFSTGDDVALVVKFMCTEEVRRPILGLTVKTPDGIEVAGSNSRDAVLGEQFVPRRSGEVAYARFEFRCHLNGGNYLLSVGLAEETDEGVVPLDRRFDSIILQVVNARRSFGLVELGIDVSQSGDAGPGEAPHGPSGRWLGEGRAGEASAEPLAGRP